MKKIGPRGKGRASEICLCTSATEVFTWGNNALKLVLIIRNFPPGRVLHCNLFTHFQADPGYIVVC